MFAEPAEEGAQVVMGPTRCAAPWRLPTRCATALPHEPAQPLSMRAAPTDAWPPAARLLGRSGRGPNRKPSPPASRPAGQGSTVLSEQD